jgi:hypothetical protein
VFEERVRVVESMKSDDNLILEDTEETLRKKESLYKEMGSLEEKPLSLESRLSTSAEMRGLLNNECKNI